MSVRLEGVLCCGKHSFVFVAPVLVEWHENNDARGDDGKDGHKVHRRAVSEQHVDQKKPKEDDAHGLCGADLATGHDEAYWSCLRGIDGKNVYPKVGFWVHIDENMYPKVGFRVHVAETS